MSLFEVFGTVAAYFVQSCYACGSCTVQSGTPHNARSTHCNFGEAQAESSLMMVSVNRNMFGATIIILNDFNSLKIL